MAQQQQQRQRAGVGAGAGAGAGTVPQPDLAALRDNPQIQQLRELVHQNPALIQPLLQQLAQSNPGLAQVLAQNPEALLQLLGGSDDETASGDLPPGAQVISVTPEEREAIERVSLRYHSGSFISHQF